MNQAERNYAGPSDQPTRQRDVTAALPRLDALVDELYRLNTTLCSCAESVRTCPEKGEGDRVPDDSSLAGKLDTITRQLSTAREYAARLENGLLG